MPGADRSYIASLDSELMQSADLVLYMNRAFWSDGKCSNPNSLLIGHGVDYDFFANASHNQDVPDDIASIPRPMIGWFGDLSDKTSDLELVEYNAPDWAQSPLPHSAEEPIPDPLPLERAGRTLEA